MVLGTQVIQILTNSLFFAAVRKQGDAAFDSWLYHIAENVCIDYFRKQKQKENIESFLADT